MKIAVVGAGGIGGLLGVKLALAGHEVCFLARNRNLDAINARGFRLRGEDGSEQHAAGVRAVARGEQAGPQDAVLLTVKAHQVGDVLAGLAGFLGPETPVVTMINGVPWWYFHRHGGEHDGRQLQSVDPGGMIAAAIAPRRVIGSVVYPAAELVEPGVVRLVEGNRFTLGEPDGSRSPRVEALSQAFMAAGFKAPVSKDIRGEIWVKLWGNLSFNPISALTHLTLEQICRFAPTRALAAAMMSEAQQVAEALGVRFKITLEQRIAGAEAVGAHKTSMLQDVEAGRALELAALVGAVVELGAITGVATPHIAAIHAAALGLQERLLVGGGARVAAQPR
jgi:2-dehydropantoate 2-reductase